MTELAWLFFIPITLPNQVAHPVNIMTLSTFFFMICILALLDKPKSRLNKINFSTPGVYVLHDQ